MKTFSQLVNDKFNKSLTFQNQSPIPGLVVANAFTKWDEKSSKIEGFIEFFITDGDALTEKDLRAKVKQYTHFGKPLRHHLLSGCTHYVKPVFLMGEYKWRAFINTEQFDRCMDYAFAKALEVASEIHPFKYIDDGKGKGNTKKVNTSSEEYINKVMLALASEMEPGMEDFDETLKEMFSFIRSPSHGDILFTKHYFHIYDGNEYSSFGPQDVDHWEGHRDRNLNKHIVDTRGAVDTAVE